MEREAHFGSNPSPNVIRIRNEGRGRGTLLILDGTTQSGGGLFDGLEQFGEACADDRHRRFLGDWRHLL
jgi:hypothetical protein